MFGWFRTILRIARCEASVPCGNWQENNRKHTSFARITRPLPVVKLGAPHHGPCQNRCARFLVLLFFLEGLLWALENPTDLECFRCIFVFFGRKPVQPVWASSVDVQTLKMNKTLANSCKFAPQSDSSQLNSQGLVYNQGRTLNYVNELKIQTFMSFPVSEGLAIVGMIVFSKLVWIAATPP